MKKLDNFASSLNVLKNADFELADENEIYRTGIIGQFNLTFELAWKALQAVLNVPIDSGQFYFRVQCFRGNTADKTGKSRGRLGVNGRPDTRNILAHTYSDEQALKAIWDVKTTYLSLFQNLKREIDANWME